MHVEGLGDVCSLATFDLARHGNPRYGSPLACPKARGTTAAPPLFARAAAAARSICRCVLICPDV